MSVELSESLGAEYRVIILDRPGHGYSSAPADTLDIVVANVECARSIMREFGAGSAMIVAHSWGALPALKWAAMYPTEVDGMVIAAGWLYQEPSVLLQLVSRFIALPAALVAWLLLVLMRRSILMRLAHRAFAPCMPDPEFMAQCVALWLNTPQVIATVIRELGCRFTPDDFIEHCTRTGVPAVLLITGAADTMVSPEEHTFRFHRALPMATLVIVHGTGHMPIRSACAQLVPIILDFARNPQQSGQQITIWHDTASNARQLVLRYGWNSTSYQTLNAGMVHWFSRDREAMAAYVMRLGVRVCAGPPLCSEADLPIITEQFTANSRQCGDRVCFFAVEERLCDVLQTQRRLCRLQIGSQPVWRPEDWNTVTAAHKSLRLQLHRARNKGVIVHEQAVSPPPDIGELFSCLQDWQSRRTLPPLKFLTESVPLELLSDRRLFTAVHNGRVVGYLAAAPVPLRRGWLIEQIVRSHSAPNGTAELLVDAAMSTFASEGSQYATLGLAPLSQLASGFSNAPGWLRLLTIWMRLHGNRFYNFGGLEAFKAKLGPASWEPIYLVSMGSQITPREIIAVASAFCSQNLLHVVQHVLVASVRQETQHLRSSRTR
jgi:phosphatidylglycerol lysyltransferase